VQRGSVAASKSIMTNQTLLHQVYTPDFNNNTEEKTDSDVPGLVLPPKTPEEGDNVGNSTKRGEPRYRLFIGRIVKKLSFNDIRNYFCQFGELRDL
jgi:RNA recognition motif-containing protein